MSVVTVCSLVFNVGGVDGNLTSLLFWGTINIFVSHGIRPSLLTQNLGDSLGQGCLSVIDMTNGSNVDVRLGSVKIGGKTTAQVQGMSRAIESGDD